MNKTLKGCDYMAKQKAIYIKMSEEQHQKWKEYAVKNKTNLSELVRTCVEEHIKRGEDNGR